MKFNVGNEYCFSLSFSDTVDIDIKFMRYHHYVSVRFQVLPSPWQPQGKSSKLGKLQPHRKIFLSNAQLPDFPGTFILINFTLFHHFQDLHH